MKIQSNKQSILQSLLTISFWDTNVNHNTDNDISFTKFVTADDNLKFTVKHTDNKKSEFPDRLISVLKDTWNDFVSEDLLEYLRNESRYIDVLRVEMWVVDFTIYARFRVLCVKNDNRSDTCWYWSRTPAIHQILYTNKDDDGGIDFINKKVSEVWVDVSLGDEGTRTLCLENIGIGIEKV